jgi:hypothetical protein
VGRTEIVKPSVFISYTCRDKWGLGFAYKLKDALDKHGYTDVFLFDHSKSNHLGQPIWDMLARQIRDRDVMIVVCTPSIEVSGAVREYNIAMSLQRMMVPLRYDNVPIPLALTADTGDDFTDDDVLKKFEDLASSRLEKTYGEFITAKTRRETIVKSETTSLQMSSTETIPSLPRSATLPLSGDRITRFTSEARRAFEHTSIGRAILPPSKPLSAEGFELIQAKLIVDRVFFVEGLIDGKYYVAPSGYEYGASVAEGELYTILNMLLRASVESGRLEKQVIEISDTLGESDVTRAIDTMRTWGFQPSIILTNIYQNHKFWEFRRFSPYYSPDYLTRTRPAYSEGTYDGIPVHYSRLLPNGLTLLGDKTKLGLLEIESDFEVSVTDIPPADRESIRKRFPKLSDEDLAEKVRILSGEMLKPRIQGEGPHFAYCLVMTKGTRLSVGPPETTDIRT